MTEIQLPNDWETELGSMLREIPTLTSGRGSVARCHPLPRRREPLNQANRLLPLEDRRPEKIDANLRPVLRDLVAGQAPWPLFLHGLAGRGKSCAALCLLDYAGGVYHALPDLLALLIRAMKGEEYQESASDYWRVTEADVWKKINDAPLVVLDEIGTRQPSDHNYQSVKRLLDQRAFRPHVVISNCDLGTLAQLYDDRVASRLAAGTVVELVGDDRRLQK
jgi:hypothetical protein